MSDVRRGDTAMLTEPSNYGRLVHVNHRHDSTYWHVTALQTVALWNLDGPHRPAVDYPAGTEFLCFHRYLRPIRDTDGEDEVAKLARENHAGHSPFPRIDPEFHPKPQREFVR